MVRSTHAHASWHGEFSNLEDAMREIVAVVHLWRSGMLRAPSSGSWAGDTARPKTGFVVQIDIAILPNLGEQLTALVEPPDCPALLPVAGAAFRRLSER